MKRLGFKELKLQHLKKRRVRSADAGAGSASASHSEAPTKWVADKYVSSAHLNPAVLERYEPPLDNTPYLPKHRYSSAVLICLIDMSGLIWTRIVK